MEDGLVRVMLGWLLNWCNCPDRKLSSGRKQEVITAKRAAGDETGRLFRASKADLAAALDQALGKFPDLCPDVPEERRLRMAARLARVLEGDRLSHAEMTGLAPEDHPAEPGAPPASPPAPSEGATGGPVGGPTGGAPD